jgi:hypothetical protein
MLPSYSSRRSSAVRDFPCSAACGVGHHSSIGAVLPPCQKLTCTFVSIAMHTLQRVHREWNSRAREFLPGVRDAPAGVLTSHRP